MDRVFVLSCDNLKLWNLFAVEHSSLNFSQIILHLGNLFFTIGSVELSNKMVLYMSDQKVFVVKTICYSDVSCFAVEKQRH